MSEWAKELDRPSSTQHHSHASLLDANLRRSSSSGRHLIGLLPAKQQHCTSVQLPGGTIIKGQSLLFLELDLLDLMAFNKEGYLGTSSRMSFVYTFFFLEVKIPKA